MELTRWTNPSLPQTLQVAVLLFYIGGVVSVLTGSIGSPLVALLVGGGVAAGLGIANERRWGYRLAVAVTSVRIGLLALVLASEGIGTILEVDLLLAAVLPVALFVAVVHPQSRAHQRVWFR